MLRVGISVVLLASLTAALGCSDDPPPRPEPDSSAADASPIDSADAPPPAPDTAVDAAFGALSCTEIVTCQQGCGGDVGCVEECRTSGTAAAQSIYSAISQCVSLAVSEGGPCETDCYDVSDLTPRCRACIDGQCAPSFRRCFLGTQTPPDAGVADAGPELSCSGILDCVSACGSDLACQYGCPPKGSYAARLLFYELDGCFQKALAGSCKAECPTADAASCTECLIAACGDELLAC